MQKRRRITSGHLRNASVMHLNRISRSGKAGFPTRGLELYAGQAKAQKLPSVNGSIAQNFNWAKSNATGESGLSGSNNTSYSVSSGVTIFNASKLTNLIKQAELDIEGGNYSLETTKESISLNILNAYVQVLYAEEQVKEQ